jgi:hypothetical protein
MKVTRSIVLGTVFLIGCAVGGISSQFVAPPVRAGTNPTRWEYYCLEHRDKAIERMDKLGAEGWELTTGTTAIFPQAVDPTNPDNYYYMWCFKRPL